MESKKLNLVAALVLLASLDKPIGASAQPEGVAQEPVQSLASGAQAQTLDDHNNEQTNSRHHGKPENGPLAVSAVTVVDGAYATNQIATLPEYGGPYKFLTNLPNGALDPVFDRDGDKIFFWGPVENGPDGIYSVPVEGGDVVQLQTDCITNPNCLGEETQQFRPMAENCWRGVHWAPSMKMAALRLLAFTGCESTAPVQDRFRKLALPARRTSNRAGRRMAAALFFSTKT